MFRALSVHLQEDTVVYMQHMVMSLSTNVRGGLSVYRLSSYSFDFYAQFEELLQCFLQFCLLLTVLISLRQ